MKNPIKHVHYLSAINYITHVEVEDLDDGDVNKVHWLSNDQVHIYIGCHHRLDKITFRRHVDKKHKRAITTLITEHKEGTYGLGDWSFAHSKSINQGLSIKSIAKYHVIFPLVTPIDKNQIYVM